MSHLLLPIFMQHILALMTVWWASVWWVYVSLSLSNISIPKLHSFRESCTKIFGSSTTADWLINWLLLGQCTYRKHVYCFVCLDIYYPVYIKCYCTFNVFLVIKGGIVHVDLYKTEAEWQRSRRRCMFLVYTTSLSAAADNWDARCSFLFGESSEGFQRFPYHMRLSKIL